MMFPLVWSCLMQMHTYIAFLNYSGIVIMPLWELKINKLALVIIYLVI